MQKKEMFNTVFSPFKEWLKRKGLEEVRFCSEAWDVLALLALWNEFIYETQEAIKTRRNQEKIEDQSKE